MQLFLTRFCWSLTGLPVLHPELHGSPARHRGSLRQTGHLRVLLHPRRADGRAAVRTRHQPQLQGQQRKQTEVVREEASSLFKPQN